MTSPAIVGAVLRIDLRGFADDPPPALGAPMRETVTGDGTRSLFYDLTGETAGAVGAEAFARLAHRLDRLFLAPATPPFGEAFARRIRLDIGLALVDGGAPFSHDVPHALLDCLGQIEAELGLSYYPCAGDDAGTTD